MTSKEDDELLYGFFKVTRLVNALSEILLNLWHDGHSMVESRVGSIAGLVQGHSSNPQVSTLEVVPSQGLDLGELAQGWVELGQDLG